MKFICYLYLFFLFNIFILTPQVNSVSPSLLNATVYYQNTTLLDFQAEVARVDLTFDQDLYLNQALLCPYSDQSCGATPTCQACDWTSASASSQCGASSFSSCCANPLDDPDSASPSNYLEWCSPSVPFEVIPVDPQAVLPATFSSSLVTLAAGAQRQYRFLLPASAFCSPVRISVRANYGSVWLFYSNRFALPDNTRLDGQVAFLYPTFGYGQSFVDLCPTYDPHYAPGTYALTAYAPEASEFFLELSVAPALPYLPPVPSPAFSCSDVDTSGTNATCVDNGSTHESVFVLSADGGSSPYYQYWLPVPPGCHTIAASTYAVYEDAFSLLTDPDIFCLDTEDLPLIVRETSIQGRFRTGPDTVTFSGCFDRPTVVRCAVQAWIPGRGLFTWSTAAPAFRVPVTAPSPYDYALLEGISSAQLIFFNSSIQHPSFCIDWSAACIGAWAVAPYDSPMFLYPPPPIYSLQTPFETIRLQPPLPEYYAPLQRLPRTISLVVLVSSNVASEVSSYSPQNLFDQGFITLTTITNAQGEPPRFDDGNPDSPPYLFSVPFADLHEIAIGPECDEVSFSAINKLNHQVRDLLTASVDLFSTFQYRSDLDVAAASLRYQSCFDHFVSMLDPTPTLLPVLTDQCVYPGTFEATLDPCCSPPWRAVTCCLPTLHTLELSVWDTDPAETYATCRSPDCAATYFQDLSDSLNIQNDPTLSCPDISLTELQGSAARVSDILRECRIQVGLGNDFTGVPCLSDADCPFSPFRCQLAAGVCYAPLRSEAESAYLHCFIDAMPVSFEDWLKNFILPPSLFDVPRDSPQFYDGMFALLRNLDCVSNRSLDIHQRNHWVYDSDSDQCKSFLLDLSAEDAAGIAHGCPAINCLDESCFVPAHQCYRFCSAAWSFQTASNATCLTNETVCTISPGDTCPPALEGTFTCAYCPPDGSLPCQPVAGPTSQQECEQASICETPDGQFIAGLAPSACAALNPHCSIECGSPSCHPSGTRSGVCQYTAATSSGQCTYSGAFFSNGGCFAGDVADAAECVGLPGGATWQTCDGLFPCGLSTPAGSYLGCYVSPYGPCTTSAACLQATRCSDRDYAFRIDPSTNVYHSGGCFLSGFYQPWITDDSTNCPLGMLRTPNGCFSPAITDPQQCQGVAFFPADGVFMWQEWRNPAQNQAQCFASSNTSSGCLKSELREYRTLWRQGEICEACGGIPSYPWTWEAGTWVSGQTRPLSWVKYETVAKLDWDPNALSFQQFSTWIQQYIEYRSTFAIRSAGLCRFDLFDQPMSFLSCDCLSNSGNCPSTSISRIYSIARPCFSEALLIKTLSATVTFYTFSISSSCLTVITAEIPQSNVMITPDRPHLSAQLAYPATRDYIVRNDGGLHVGAIVSNGIVLSSANSAEAALVATYQLCILINTPLSPDPALYPIPDFAFSRTSDQIAVVHPLGLPIVIHETDAGTYWCSNLTSLYPAVFAVFRKADYQEGEFNAYSESDIAMSYTLAALYSVLILFTVILFLFLLASAPKFYLYFLALPCFVLLCIFRLVYCYALPSEVWIDNSVAGFIIFELPTFFYFSAVCFVLLSFIDVLSCFNFALEKPLKICVIIFLALAWCLFISVAVADGVISSQSDSNCPGRVPPSDAIDQKLRNLSIAYQSILVAFAVLLVIGLFFVLSMIIQNTLEAHRNVKNALFSLKELLKDSLTMTFGFLIRSILFIAYWSSQIDSTPYVFVTCMVTEVLVLTIIIIIWYFRFSFAADRWRSSSGSQLGSQPGTVSPKRSSL